MYMPIAGPGLETRQNSIRLKNLLAAAEETLRAGRVRAAVVRRMLSSARRLVRLTRFWRTPAGGLALYLADGFFQFFKVPLVFPERLTVARQFVAHAPFVLGRRAFLRPGRQPEARTTV